ncbi:hypothetical protein HYW59_01635 [Candidatus Kaiserbacteria bacterium]|nr:hypothetical protein [Candidatus Kaiserbacteria bacterium]
MIRSSFGFAASVAIVVVSVAGAAALATAPSVSFVRLGATSTPPALETKPTVKHLPTPEPMYAIYMTQCAVGTPSLRNTLVEFIDSTKLNAVVIDIKDYAGKIAYPTENPILSGSVSEKCGADDMKEFVETLHDKGIYVVGRVTVFQDPFYTKHHPEQSVLSKGRPGEPWKDFKGLSFVAVNSMTFWDYIVELSKESYALGFDELNYDYVRWPSDGPMSDIAYPSTDRAGELEKFFAYLHERVAPIGVKMSVDLFGYTTVLTDDLGIGQQIERAFPYFDYVAPMVYPSHYNKGFAGLSNPNSDPYAVVHVSMVEAVRRAKATETPVATMNAMPIMRTEIVPATVTSATTTREVATGMYSKSAYSPLKLRPWLQDFDYGKDYLPADILAQTKATYDAGLTSWFFWDPANRYTSLRQVLQTE